MSGLIASLAGAPQAASVAEQFSTDAAKQIASQYGSPLANQYGAMEMGAERPMQQALLNQAAAGAAAAGITGSGEGRANIGNVDAQNSATLAQNIAPLYQQGMQESAGVIGAMPGMEENAYQNSIQQMYQAIQMAGEAAAGIPPQAGQGPQYGPAGQGGGSGGTGYYAPGDPSGVSNTPYMP